MSAFALIEVVGIAYLRADLLLVGRVLGPATGAVYGLLSRLIDGLLGIQNSISLWLFADAAHRSENGDDVATSPIRARSLLVFPRLAVACSFVGIVAAPLLGRLVPSLEPTVDTLRLLLVALPFFVLSAVETFTRSAAGRNRSIVAVLAAGLAVNVGLNLLLLSAIGLTGAGWALLGSECVQVLLLYRCSNADDRRLLRQVVPEVFGWGAVLLLLAVGMNLSLPLLVGVAVTVALAGGLTMLVRTRTARAIA
jgi:O-antigen/teichoic acid export membrane protein